MYQRYLVLAIIIASMCVIPASSSPQTIIQTLPNTNSTLIETKLQMEIALASGQQATSALLEFDDQLTQAEIQYAESLGVRFDRRDSSIVHVGRIYSAYVDDVESLQQITEIGLIRATSGSKQYVPSITSSMPAIQADDVWTNLKTGGETVNGTGTTVAVIDTGAQWLHPSFWKQYPAEFDFIQSGPDYYLDLNGNAIPEPDEGPILSVYGQTGQYFTYASDYMYISSDGSGDFDYASGDRWIAGIDANHDNSIDLNSEKGVILNISKVAILYDQFSSNVYIRGVNLTDAVNVGDSHSSYHGTHVSSTIAGGQPGFTSYVGAAPGADLIIIRSPLNSADILDGVSFAIEHDADIINMSFSSYLGFMDGTDPEDLVVTEAFLQYGILTTAAAGNLGTRNKHARFEVGSNDTSTLLLQVSHEPDYSYLSLLWHSDDQDETVTLVPPSGPEIELGEYSQIAGTSFALDTDELSAYVFCEVSPRGMNNIVIQVSEDDHDWLDGVWDIVVANPGGDAVWIDGYAWDGAWETSHMRFNNHISDLYTISSPATADYAIAVSSYSEVSSSITSTSSRGPRIDGAPKPNIAAPGVSITAASGSFLTDSVLWRSKDGTSMASPHVAGVLALIRQAEGNDNPWLDYSALVNGAGLSYSEIPSNDWGHGLCNAVSSVMYVLNETLDSSSTASDWLYLDPIVTDGDELGVTADLDIRSVKVFQEEDSIAFAIFTDGLSDFSGTDMLSVEWDTDDSLLTGINGADLLLNLTANTLSIYEWSGSVYEVASYSPSWWQSGTTTVLKIDGIAQGLRGNVITSTHNATQTYLDTTSSASLSNTWRPMLENVNLDISDDDLSIGIETFDRDSRVNSRSIGISIVDGDLHVLQSSIGTGQNIHEIVVNSSNVFSEYVNSILLNVSSEGQTLHLPLIMLNLFVDSFIRITNATLDSSVVRVGLLFSERITGSFSIFGYELVSQVQIGFKHTSGLWFNFTINGDGLYEFVIVPSGFPTGEYEVYAIAKGNSIPNIEMQFATLTLIDNNTLILVGVGVAVVAIVVIFALRRRGVKE